VPADLPPECRDLLRIQAGAISRQQALGTGLSQSVIDGQLRTGRWQRLQLGVYAAFSGPPNRPTRLWAAVLRAGPGAALSHYTAAELFGLTTKAAPLIHLTLPALKHPGQIYGAVVHRSRMIEQSRHPALLPPRTRVEDTMLDLAQLSPDFDQAFDWLCRAVGRRLTTADNLQAALAKRRRSCWRAELTLAFAEVADGVRSVLERRYVRGVERAHGLPAARRQAKIVTGGQTRYIDNLYDEAQLAVELDGQLGHPPERRWADSRRDNAHATAGILTVRYNWADVTERPCFVAAQVAGLLSIRGTQVVLRQCGPACTAGSLPRGGP
jgi:hypothetical protein